MCLFAHCIHICRGEPPTLYMYALSRALKLANFLGTGKYTIGDTR